MYASSTTTRTSAGTASRKRSSSARWIALPVGLLGLQTKISRVFGVIAASIASRSWSSVAVSGTGTGVAPATWTMIGYASKERQAKITSSPGPAVARISDWATPTEPVPVAMCSTGTPKRCASSSVSPETAMSG